MFDQTETASVIFITVDGQSLDEKEGSGLIEVIVDQHAHLPNMFTIRLFDPDMTLLDGKKLSDGQIVEVKSKGGDDTLITLITGEITSVEPMFEEDGVSLVVRGYDRSFHMYHTVRSRTFVNVKDSDLAEKIAQEWNLKSVIEPTPLVHNHIFQHNQNDLAFLVQRAWRIGYECFVKGDTLYFRRPQSTAQPNLTLKWGFDLLTFRPRMSHAEQVNEVVVRGWDPATQKAIIGRAHTGKLFANTTRTPSTFSEEVDFGDGKLILVDYPVGSQTEADLLAQARMDELSGSFVSAEGTAFRRPEITAGDTVTLEGLGRQFSGQFLITSARHIFTDSDGLETTFLINGTRTGLLIDEMLSFDTMDRFYGVVTAVVTNNNDPQKLGRVKLKYPWLDTRFDSDWVYVSTIGAGQGSGLFSPPAVDDQVLVAFTHGDFNRPIVIGGLPRAPFAYEGPLSTQGDPAITRWASRQGHMLELSDALDRSGMRLKTAGGHQIEMDDQAGALTIRSKSGCEIVISDADGSISIRSGGDLQLQAAGNLALQSEGDIDLVASGDMRLKGRRIDLN